MANSGVRQFKSFVADFRSVRSLALKASLAAPLAGIWTKMAPPPALWNSFLSSLAECLILVWAFRFWSDSSSADHDRRMKCSIVLFCITAMAAIGGLSLFSVSPGPGRERVVEGFILQPAVRHILSATYTPADALRDSEFDSTAVWTKWSVTLMQVAQQCSVGSNVHLTFGLPRELRRGSSKTAADGEEPIASGHAVVDGCCALSAKAAVTATV
jgi:hypothetical protein